MKHTLLDIKDFSFSYGSTAVLENVTVSIKKQAITAIYGKSGSGKSTFLKACALLHKEQPGTSAQGQIILNENNHSVDILSLTEQFWKIRRKMVYISQQPNPLPMSILKNVTFPLKISGEKDKALMEHKAIEALKKVHLFDEVKDRLCDNADELSGGQQQRLCIARALVLEPLILLMDEPTSSLDSHNKENMESLILELGQSTTILFASHDMNQIQTIAGNTIECANRQMVQKLYETINGDDGR